MRPEAPAPDAALLAYYARRAGEYERVYDKPERQGELAWLGEELPRRMRGCRLLELACGTGYWTRRLATVAAQVVAIDRRREVLELARCSVAGVAPVAWVEADALDPPLRPGCFDVCFAGFLWSHVPRRTLRGWLFAVGRVLGPGARLIVLDNRYVEGSSTPIADIDTHGDSWQHRRLADGSVHCVLKNFPDDRELRAVLGAMGTVAVEHTDHYWLATATVAG